jgi:hypothetical protein
VQELACKRLTGVTTAFIACKQAPAPAPSEYLFPNSRYGKFHVLRFHDSVTRSLQRASLYANDPMITPRRPSICLCMACALLLLATTLYGAADTAKRTYDLPAGEAAVTLRQFADISGREVIFAAEAVRGVRTREVRGELSAVEALERMLKGTKLYLQVDAATGALAVRSKADKPVQGASEKRERRTADFRSRSPI